VIPVGDFVKRRTTPYVNWAIILANFAVFFYTTFHFTTDRQVTNFFYDWGFVPACLADQLGISSGAAARDVAAACTTGDRAFLQPFTSMFIHAGWAHILGNMLFLWIFGDNVEDRVGHLRYLVFYALCGLGAVTLQSALSLDNVVPNVGASGAIAGVLAGYLLMYPTAIVEVIILPLFFIPFFVPAVILIGLWFMTQLFTGIGELGTSSAGSGVAWWAHVGGFATGAVLIWFFKQPGRAGAGWTDRFRASPDT
jgi:membrane associated rhomboid family serine protease